MDAPLKKDEPDSPRFYHLELYDSLENLFPEEPFRRRDLSPHEKKETPDVEEQHPPHVEDRDQQPTDHAKENNEKSDSDLLEDKEASQRSYQEKELYCITCCVPVTPSNSKNNEHQEHEVMSLAAVVEIAKDALQQNIGRLEDQIAHLESFASHLEEIFITVEENFTRQQQNFEKRYDDIIQILEQRYEENMQALGEEKKEKLEALYKELVDCGENLDTCKELMETIENLDQGEKKIEALKTAVATIQRVHTFLKKNVSIDLSTPAEFEDRIIHFSDIQELLESVSSSQISPFLIAAFTPPCAPVMNAQDPNSATGTSVKVCWSFFSEDIVESYQLYYKRVSNDTSSKGEEEFKLNVKETYCTVAQLLPNTQYEFWVKAVNRAGVSSESERAVYMTAPLPPVIKKKAIQSCEYFALVQWECGNTNPVDSYTVELSKVAGGDGGEILTESVVGIPNCETLIQLEPKQSYLLFVKALNIGGSSERSEPASILSTGTVFTLNEKTAHPLLSILEDGLTLACHETKRAQSDTPFGEDSFTRSIAALGYPIPFRGKHYWEVDVDENTEYCIGVAFENVPREDYLGKSHSSWCMKHTITSSSHLYEFLNNGMTPDIKITVPPEKIGLLLDYDEGILSFFNADIKQHLHTFHNNFQDFVCPCFAMEGIGVLRIRNGITVPPHIVL